MQNTTTKTASKSKLNVGDRIAYAASFLRSIGAVAGPLGHARGKITVLKSYGAGFTIAKIACVNVNNLSRVGGAGFCAL